MERGKAGAETPSPAMREEALQAEDPVRS
jgi:hypothetical protein